MNNQRYKGTRDLTPEDMKRFHIVERAFRTGCLQWGYQEVKTPVIEYLHLFTSAGTLTPTMLSRVFSFLDWDGWSGERVVLRPDVTIPVARFYTENMAGSSQSRLFYVANVFGYEESGKKTRERWQCGAEFIGTSSFTADVELVMLAQEVLHKTGLKQVELHLSHAGIIRGLLQKLELSQDEQQQIFDQILDGDEEALARVKSVKPELEGMFNFLLNQKGQSSGSIKNFKALVPQSYPELQAEVDNFVAIIDLLQDLGYELRIDFTSVRGFEYYTGMIFQLFLNGEKIGGGGRYDDLISSMGATATPASGFALYLDRLMDLIDPRNLAELPAERFIINVKDNDSALIKEGFGIAGMLRNEGYIVALFPDEPGKGDFRWEIGIQDRSPRFVISDRTGQKRYEAQNAAEVMKLLRRK
jgi:histidyl-tRNA synthetase